MNSGGNPDDVQVLDYPWVYILIPGLVCFVIIVVVTLVIFKKVHESRKRTVTYCRGETVQQVGLRPECLAVCVCVYVFPQAGMCVYVRLLPLYKITYNCVILKLIHAHTVSLS